MFAISIGFCIDRVPVVGVVYNPITAELFSAAKGQGATLNGVLIRAEDNENELTRALIITANISYNDGISEFCRKALAIPCRGVYTERKMTL